MERTTAMSATITDLLAQLRHSDAGLSRLLQQVDRSKAERNAVIAEIARTLNIAPAVKVSVSDEPWRDENGRLFLLSREAGGWFWCGQWVAERTEEVVVCAVEENNHGVYRFSEASRVVRPLSAEVR